MGQHNRFTMTSEDVERMRAAAHSDDVRLADQLAVRMLADINHMFDVVNDLTVDEMYGPDGRVPGYPILRGVFAGERLDLCAWCRADRYDHTGRCARCNEPFYDGVLAWVGPSTATLTPCALRFGGGSRSPSDHLNVISRMMRHRGPGSDLAHELGWRRPDTESF